jgi:hypothetical protein
MHAISYIPATPNKIEYNNLVHCEMGLYVILLYRSVLYLL